MGLAPLRASLTICSLTMSLLYAPPWMHRRLLHLWSYDHYCGTPWGWGWDCWGWDGYDPWLAWRPYWGVRTSDNQRLVESTVQPTPVETALKSMDVAMRIEGTRQAQNSATAQRTR